MSIVKRSDVREELRKALMQQTGWQHGQGIMDSSFLYHTEHDATPESDVPAHFGLDSDNGQMLSGVIGTVAPVVLTPQIVGQTNMVEIWDQGIKNFGNLVDRFHTRFNRYLEHHLFVLIEDAYEDIDVMLPDGLFNPIIPMPSEATKTAFRRFLSENLKESFPKLREFDPVIQPSVFAQLFSGSNINSMRNLIETKVVFGRGL